MHERLGNRAAAEDAVRRVVNERLAQDDILGAATLVEARLHAADESLDLLLGAWPASRQAAGCLGAAFQRFARLGRHETALERLAQLTCEPIPTALVLPLLTTLGGPARHYPDDRVRHSAADFSRVLIARQLGQPTVSSDETGQLMECLVRLAPQDRLLVRDSNRYLLARRDRELRAHRVTPKPTTGNRPVVERRFELPRQMEWLQLRSEWHGFFALGVTAKRLTMVRGIWEGEIQSVSWNCSAVLVRNAALVFEPTREQGREVALAIASGVRLEPKHFPASDLFFGRDCVAGTPDWLPEHDFPIAFGEETVWSVHVAVGRAVLSCHDQRGTLRRTMDVTSDLLAEADRTERSRLCLKAIGNNAAIALGNRLVLTRSDGGLTRVELPGQVVGLLPTLPHTRPGVAVMLEHGAAMHWVGATDLIGLDRDLASPQGTFVPGGPLVLLSRFQLWLIEVDSAGVHQVTRLELTGQHPIAVCATSNPGQFAVLGAKGEMTVYRVPR